MALIFWSLESITERSDLFTYTENTLNSVGAEMLWLIPDVDWRWGRWLPLCLNIGPLQNPKYEEIYTNSHVYMVRLDKLHNNHVWICGHFWILPSLQVHHWGGLSRAHHAGGDSRRKPLHRLPHLKSDGAPCLLIHHFNHWTHRAAASLCLRQHRDWIGLLDHRLHPWQWALHLNYRGKWPLWPKLT